jgi:hypothetical protein
VDGPPQVPVVVWLNAERRTVRISAATVGLLDLLAASGIRYGLRTRDWQDRSLGAEPLLDWAGGLAGALEIVINGRLATAGVAHLRVAPGDEVVIGQPAYLRERFPFFR